jgi:hypothetical protein
MPSEVSQIYAAPSPVKVLEDAIRKTIDECLAKHKYNYAELIGVLHLIAGDAVRSAQNNA